MFIAFEPVEVFVAISVDSRNRGLGEWEVARGWESGVNLTPRQVFTLLVKEGTSRVVLAHNHPSGDPTPIPEDVRFTARLLEAARTLDIKVLARTGRLQSRTGSSGRTGVVRSPYVAGCAPDPFSEPALPQATRTSLFW